MQSEALSFGVAVHVDQGLRVVNTMIASGLKFRVAGLGFRALGGSFGGEKQSENS